MRTILLADTAGLASTLFKKMSCSQNPIINKYMDIECILPAVTASLDSDISTKVLANTLVSLKYPFRQDREKTLLTLAQGSEAVAKALIVEVFRSCHPDTHKIIQRAFEERGVVYNPEAGSVSLSYDGGATDMKWTSRRACLSLQKWYVSSYVSLQFILGSNELALNLVVNDLIDKKLLWSGEIATLLDLSPKKAFERLVLIMARKPVPPQAFLRSVLEIIDDSGGREAIGIYDSLGLLRMLKIMSSTDDVEISRHIQEEIKRIKQLDF